MGTVLHTPGPWGIDGFDPLVIVDRGGGSIGEMVPGFPMAEAEAIGNARLAAAAPQMLATIAACDLFFRVAMPKMNIRNSFLDADAISAWNKAEMAISHALALVEGREDAR